MKNSSSRKGFTVVELVIVIAVIAVLAAVLIPTFSSLIKKANDSAYLQERTNQQIADLAEKVENQDFLSWADLEAKLAEELAQIDTVDEEGVTDAIAKALAKFENSLKTDDTALTEAQVKAIVEKALEGQLTSAQVEAIVKEAVKKTDGSELTAAEVKSIVDSAVASLNKETGITKEEMAEAINSALEGKDGLQPTDVETIINNALAGFGHGYDLTASEVKTIIENAMSASKEKADVIAAEEMTAVIEAANATTFNAAVEALTAAGYNVSALTPIRSGYVFCVAANEVKCVEANAIPEGGKDIVKEGAALVVADVKDAASFEAALENGNSITLEADIKLDAQLKIDAGKKVTLDLNSKTITTEQITGRSKYLDVEGELVIENGTIEARGVEVLDGGKLTIGENANVTIANVDSNGGAALWIYAGGEVEINGGTFTALNGVKDYSNDYKYNPGALYNEGKVTINGGTFKTAETVCYAITNKGEMEINGGTFEGTHGILANYGTMTVNDGTFTLKAYKDGTFDGHVVYCAGGTVNVNGGTFGGYTSVFYENGGVIEDNR